MNKKLIIFDIDGTLCDTVGADDSTYKKAFNDIFSIQFDDNLWNSIKEKTSGTDSGITNELFLQKKHCLPTKQDIYALKIHFLHLLRKHFEIHSPKEIPGAKEIIDFIIDNDELLPAIATGSWEESGKIKLKAIKIDYKTIPYANSENNVWRKDILEEAIKKSKEYYKNDFSKIIYIGDGYWDFLASKQLGLGFIGVDHHKTEILSQSGANFVINDFVDKNKFLNILSYF